MSGVNSAKNITTTSGKPIRSVIGGAGQQHPSQPPGSTSIPIPSGGSTGGDGGGGASRIADNLTASSTASNSPSANVNARENVTRNAVKQQNRHTIAVSNDNFDTFASNLASKLMHHNDEYNPRSKRHTFLFKFTKENLF